MKRSNAWWTNKFMELYHKEPTPEEMKQFKKGYYEPNWRGWSKNKEEKTNQINKK